jgi:hypothetical protein
LNADAMFAAALLLHLAIAAISSPTDLSRRSAVQLASAAATAAVGSTSAAAAGLEGAVRFFRSAFPPEVPASARKLGWRGFIAWKWKDTWPASFDTLRGGGRPFVPPILQEIVLSRDPDVVSRFAREVGDDFAFTSIVPAHFDAPIAAGKKAWLDAFRPFAPSVTAAEANGGLPDADLAFLREFERTLVAQGTVRPRPPSRIVG